MGWDIKILEDPNADYSLPEFLDFDYEIEKPIPKDYGLNVIFTVDGKGKYKTVEDEGEKRIVRFKISSWIGAGDYNAKHFYGQFTVYPPSIEILEQGTVHRDMKPGEIVSTNVLPKKFTPKFIEFELSRIAERDEYGFDPMSGEQRIETRKGRPTRGFDDLKTLREKMTLEFNRIFGDGWTLTDHNNLHDIEHEYEAFKDYK